MQMWGQTNHNKGIKINIFNDYFGFTCFMLA